MIRDVNWALSPICFGNCTCSHVTRKRWRFLACSVPISTPLFGDEALFSPCVWQCTPHPACLLPLPVVSHRNLKHVSFFAVLAEGLCATETNFLCRQTTFVRNANAFADSAATGASGNSERDTGIETSSNERCSSSPKVLLSSSHEFVEHRRRFSTVKR